MNEWQTALEVDAEALTARCDPASLPFSSTDELHAVEAVFGQERAVRAIEFALGMEAHGYNLYASGPDGIGKTSILESFLRRRAETLPAPPDWIYVHNFEDPDRPLGIALPAGAGRRFAEAVQRTVERAAEELRQAFDADSYVRQRADVGGGSEERRNAILRGLQQRAEQMGFALQMTPQGVISAPLIEGQPASDEAFAALPEEEQERIQKRLREELEPIVQDALLEMRGLEREAREQLERLDEQVAKFAIEHLFAPLRELHEERLRVVAFLDAVRADIVKERDRLRLPVQGAQVPAMGGPSPELQRELLLRRYEVNALICNDAGAGAPVITESNPTYVNLLGRIEYVGQFGTAVTDHTMVRPGTLGLASGGFLVLRMRDLLQNVATYDGLKRALHAGELAIESLQQALGLIPTAGLRPEPIDVKVVIVGEPQLYSFLYRLDPDFRELFRVKADFEVDFERTPQNIIGLASVIHSQCDRAGMHCFSDAAVARLIEHSSRQVEDQRRLSGNIGALLDLVRQADYWAGQDASVEVRLKHVERALEEREYRSSLVRDRLQHLIDNGTIFIDTDGAKVGQINALSVYDLGDISFGRPSRITCVASAGRGAIVNIERETDMAGRTHNKGFLIMRGFLADRFGQDMAMALHASLTFEQLYGDIDGDSASSTELYALLSALAEAPILQSIAVTGSLNQRGEVQPIGGATAKIEGFFDVCSARGLDGTQGVMIPHTNVPTVALRPDVAAAIAAGRFHVWAAETIEQGIEVLTGVPAGARDEHGAYPPDSIFGRVHARLEGFAATLQNGGQMAPEVAHATPAPVVAPPQPGIPLPPPPEPPIEV
ncbi:MAG: AAA family ATPase [Chloroflexi bacterium]|nr:AAA family ATPase [Chloroflexota bacterium]